jgi:hypothetical protein
VVERGFGDPTVRLAVENGGAVTTRDSRAVGAAWFRRPGACRAYNALGTRTDDCGAGGADGELHEGNRRQAITPQRSLLNRKNLYKHYNMRVSTPEKE